MTQELFLRQDILQLCGKLDAENYNVKAYRKRHANHANRNNKKILMSTDFVHSDINDDNRCQKSSEKSQKANELISARRFSATAAVKKRSAVIDMSTYVKTARTKNHSLLQQASQFQQNKNTVIINKVSEPENPTKIKFLKQQKQHNKGGKIQNKHLENWLNQILLQYCVDDKFQTSIQNAALNKYSIDKNSLLSKGINPQNLQRIYKSLFVYSMGFNTFLKEISLKNVDLKKTLWKVYAILLQYCSEGDLQTMIGQIEHDKLRKIQKMKHQIQKRQQIIQNNEEIHQQKNAKIFKELKILRQNNKNLQNDKNSIMEDFKEAEQAFNEEVSLRLKFQSKINEIHGVHRQLSMKHQKLYDDFQIKGHEYKSLKQKYDKLSNTLVILRNDNDFLTKQLKKVQQLLGLSNKATDEMKKKDIHHDITEIEWRNKKQQFNYMLSQRQKRINQLLSQLKNAELMIQMKDKSQQQLQKQYKRSLNQNNQLVTSLQNQLNKINQLIMQKKLFNQANSIFHAEISILKEKLQQKQQALKKCTALMNQYNIKKSQYQMQIQQLTSKNHESMLAMNDLFRKIEEMKRIKAQIEQELQEYKSKEVIYQNYYNEKEKIIAEMTQTIFTLEKTISEFAVIKKGLQSKALLSNQKLTSAQQAFKKKTQKIIQQNKQMDITIKQIKRQMQTNAEQLQRYKISYEQTYNKLKDQLFQRNDLELKYNQSLSVVQSQNDHIKNLNIRISELQERNEEIQRKWKGMEFILEQKQKAFKTQINQLKTNNVRLKEQVKGKNNFIHPMKCQDLQSKLWANEKKLSQLKLQFQSMQKKKSQTISTYEKKFKLLNDEIVTLQTSHNQQLTTKQSQLSHYKKLSQTLSKQSQTSQKPLQKPQQSSRYNYKQSQLKYLQIIKQKGNRIDELLKQLQVIHDSNNKMIMRLNENNVILQQNKMKVQQYQKQIRKHQGQKRGLMAQKAQLMLDKQKVMNQLKNIHNHQHQSNYEENKNYLNRPQYIQSRQMSSRQKSNRGGHQTSYRQDEKQKQKVNQPGWRNDFAKKIKNATNYYKN